MILIGYFFLDLMGIDFNYKIISVYIFILFKFFFVDQDCYRVFQRDNVLFELEDVYFWIVIIVFIFIEIQCLIGVYQ